MESFSLVAEIGWLASFPVLFVGSLFILFQSRCRDWVVGEAKDHGFQWNNPGFSLVAEIGWLASLVG